MPKSAPRRYSAGAPTKASAAMNAASTPTREVPTAAFASAMKPFSSAPVESAASTPRRRRVRQANQYKSRYSAKDDLQSRFIHGRSSSQRMLGQNFSTGTSSPNCRVSGGNLINCLFLAS